VWRKICYHLDKVDALSKGEFVAPVTCEIDVSNFCQNSCSFCMYGDYIQKHRGLIDSEVYDTLLCDLWDMGTKAILFAGGGEPLTHPHFANLAMRAHRKGFELGLITNGIALHQFLDLLQIFKFVRVSLDAATAETYKLIKQHDYFNRVCSNILLAVKDGKTVIGLNYVICPENQHEVEEARTLAKKLNVDYIHFKPMYQEERETVLPFAVKSGNAVISYRTKDTTGTSCQIAGLVGIVGADNKVYYCCQHRGDVNYALGDLTKERFSAIWKRRPSLIPSGDCGVCRYSGYANTYNEFKDPKYSFLRHVNFL
jgi:MoaA/NifB/PqqE/SkfB family radical SAM enzyme